MEFVNNIINAKYNKKGVSIDVLLLLNDLIKSNPEDRIQDA
jgi:hypothetical protein